ncbi:MAG: sulfite exporter TauE/SafE family protein, partial [Hyphomicrobiaceae bacterium]|nr:sulfite exporter TauE/SafE family protein [Hyphomicrobiaceae bacterium]
QATLNQTVDLALAVLLIVGGVVGAQLGSAASDNVRGEHLRFLLAVLILFVGIRVAYDLVLEPAERYSITTLSRGGE